MKINQITLEEIIIKLNYSLGELSNPYINGDIDKSIFKDKNKIWTVSDVAKDDEGNEVKSTDHRGFEYLDLTLKADFFNNFQDCMEEVDGKKKTKCKSTPNIKNNDKK